MINKPNGTIQCHPSRLNREEIHSENCIKIQYITYDVINPTPFYGGLHTFRNEEISITVYQIAPKNSYITTISLEYYITNS